MLDSQMTKKSVLIKELPRNGESFILSDQVADKIQLANINLRTSYFTRLGVKSGVFTDCSFTQSIFIDSYFRNAEFHNVRFTGSCFYNCNFDKAIFQTCDFRYCNFHNCKITKAEIISCLPPEPNLRRALARNLRMNYQMLGDKESADTMLDIEIHANEEELKAIFFSKSQYYKNQYNTYDQIIAGEKHVLSKASGLIWGYGHKISRLLFSYILITVILSLILYFSNGVYIQVSGGFSQRISLLESIYLGFSGPVGAASMSIYLSNLIAKIFMLIQSFLGTLFIALFAAAFYRRIAR